MTMKKLIELDAAIDVVDKRIRQIGYEDNALVLSIRQAVRDIEPVDAVPVRRGRWKEDTGGYGFWICSHCGFVSEASGADILYRYCPNCGARLIEEDNNG